jgi:hypothetical protein
MAYLIANWQCGPALNYGTSAKLMIHGRPNTSSDSYLIAKQILITYSHLHPELNTISRVSESSTGNVYRIWSVRIGKDVPYSPRFSSAFSARFIIRAMGPTKDLGSTFGPYRNVPAC